MVGEGNSPGVWWGLHFCGQKMGGCPTQGLCPQGLQSFAGASSGVGAGRSPLFLVHQLGGGGVDKLCVEAHGLGVTCTGRWRQQVGLGELPAPQGSSAGLSLPGLQSSLAVGHVWENFALEDVLLVPGLKEQLPV